MVGTIETVSELFSLLPLHILVLDQPDDTADRTLDNTLMQSTQTTALTESAAPIFLIDPQSFPTDTKVHLQPVSVETLTTLHFHLDDINLVIQHGHCELY